MRMAMNQFFAKAVYDRSNIELICFGSDTSIKHNVEKNIAELFFDFGAIIVEDSIG